MLCCNMLCKLYIHSPSVFTNKSGRDTGLWTLSLQLLTDLDISAVCNPKRHFWCRELKEFSPNFGWMWKLCLCVFGLERYACAQCAAGVFMNGDVKRHKRASLIQPAAGLITEKINKSYQGTFCYRGGSGSAYPCPELVSVVDLRIKEPQLVPVPQLVERRPLPHLIPPPFPSFTHIHPSFLSYTIGQIGFVWAL